MFAIFISGGAGFIASHFIHAFHYAFPFTHIINYDALFYSGNVLNVDASVRNSPFYHFYKGNLIDTDHVLEILKFHKVDAVVHFAAQSHVQNSFDDSLVYTRDNVFGGAAIHDENASAAAACLQTSLLLCCGSFLVT